MEGEESQLFGPGISNNNTAFGKIGKGGRWPKTMTLYCLEMFGRFDEEDIYDAFFNVYKRVQIATTPGVGREFMNFMCYQGEKPPCALDSPSLRPDTETVDLQELKRRKEEKVQRGKQRKKEAKESSKTLLEQYRRGRRPQKGPFPHYDPQNEIMLHPYCEPNNQKCCDGVCTCKEQQRKQCKELLQDCEEQASWKKISCDETTWEEKGSTEMERKKEALEQRLKEQEQARKERERRRNHKIAQKQEIDEMSKELDDINIDISYPDVEEDETDHTDSLYIEDVEVKDEKKIEDNEGEHADVLMDQEYLEQEQSAQKYAEEQSKLDEGAGIRSDGASSSNDDDNDDDDDVLLVQYFEQYRQREL